jgi:hypothetical protein
MNSPGGIECAFTKQQFVEERKLLCAETYLLEVEGLL